MDHFMFQNIIREEQRINANHGYQNQGNAAGHFKYDAPPHHHVKNDAPPPHHVKNEKPYDEQVRCSFCSQLVPSADIERHTQLHAECWEAERESENLKSDKAEDKNIKSETIENNSKHDADTAKEIVAGEDDLVNCSLCQKKVPKLTIFEHTYKHMFASIKLHPCHLCDKTFKDRTQLRNHLMVHTGEKPFQCDSCEKSFRLAQSLKNHINIHHTQANLETCDQCGETFTYKKGLLNHLSKVHGNETGFKCDKCGFRFITEKGLKTHEQDSCFKHCCPECGKVFKRNSHLEKHKETHLEKDEKAYIYNCVQCGKYFPTAIALKRHENLHLNLRPYQCFCGKSFNRKDGLKAHVKTHTLVN
eukprot:GFUD01018065.1.p1 GENE.GFUD01018065.1~~GFUD01018065.1.p1  ORF type:complete len:360 (-),score=49.48 GFUD01018065.1:133-1212(-)